MKQSRWVPVLLHASLSAVLLSAFVLRVYRLDHQSLWYDEGNSAVMAGRSVTQIVVNAAADIHPPLYYLLLHWWSGAAGNSEFALRYLSVAFGLLTAAVAIALGRRFWGDMIGIVAGLLAALSPFLVYYSQEARMYAQFSALASLSTYVFARLIGLGGAPAFTPHAGRQPGPRGRTASLSVAYVLITAAMLYTHYFAVPVLLAQIGLAFVLLLRRYAPLALARLFLVQALAVLLYVPWLPVLLRQLATWSTSTAQSSLDAVLHNVFLVFSFGLSWDATTTDKSQLLMVTLLAVGAASDLLRRRFAPGVATRALPVALLILLVPIGVVVAQETRQSTYQPKLLIPSAVAFYLLLAAGLVATASHVSRLAPRWRYTTPRTARPESPHREPNAARPGPSRSAAQRGPWQQTALGVTVALLLLALIGFFDSRSLRAYYFDPKYGRDDYRGVARFLEAEGLEGDAIVLNAPNQIEVFDYYYRGALPRYPLPEQRPLDRPLTEQDLAEVARRHQRVWIVEWATDESDPDGFINAWLGERYIASDAGEFGNVRLLRFDLRAKRIASQREGPS